jgi:transposase
MLTFFFDIERFMHHEILHQGQIVNCWYYLEVLKRLRENARRKRPQLWRNNSWFLHHDNAPAHASLLIRNVLANMNISVLPQPHYSPDLAPADFFLFPKLKSTLKGQRFQTVQEITENSQTELRATLKEACQDCFQKWQRHWEWCINAGREYFEGNKAHSDAGMSKKITTLSG